MANITFIGTGRMARVLGRRWAEAGHAITFGSREPGSKGDLAQQVAGAKVATVEDALANAEVVVLAMPFTAVEGFAHEHADALRNKVVVDLSNPFGRVFEGCVSGAEITAKAIGAGARVVAGFKDNFWETFDEPVEREGMMRDVHLAGDDEQAKEIVSELVDDLGFRPIDCGALKNARALDAMMVLIVELDQRYTGGSRRSMWKFVEDDV